MKRIFIIILLLPLAILQSIASDDSLWRHKSFAELHADWITPVNPFFSGDNVSGKPVSASASLHLKYAFSFPASSRFSQDFPVSWQGVGLSVSGFNNAIMGTPVALYIFQSSPIVRFSPTLSLDYEWNFGASAPWKTNEAVGTPVNAYIGLACVLNWNFAQNWHFTSGVGYSHFSNGNTTYPNSGVNGLVLRFGVSRDFEGRKTNVAQGDAANQRRKVSQHDKNEQSRKMIYDVSAYGAWRAKGMTIVDAPYIARGKFAVAGISFSPLYRVNRVFNVGASLDLTFDESAGIAYHLAGRGELGIKFFRPPFVEQAAAGLSLRAELSMPIFTVNIGLGHNILYKGEDMSGLYQLINLKTHITRSLYLNAGYKLSRFRDPNHLMLGLGYRF